MLDEWSGRPSVFAVRRSSLSSVVFLERLLVRLFEGLVSAALSAHQREHEWERVDEERDPEGDDLGKEPIGAVNLGVLALLSVFAEVGHVDDGVDDDSEESIRHGNVPGE